MPVSSGRKKKTKSPPAETVDQFRREQRHEITGILLIFLAIVGLWALWSGQGERGFVVRCLRAACAMLAGDVLAFIPLLYLLTLGGYLILRRKRPRLHGPWLGFIILCLVILSGFDLIKRETAWADLFDRGGGGIAGGLIALLARKAFSTAGAWLFLGAATLVAVVLASGRPMVSLIRIKPRGAAKPEKPAKERPGKPAKPAPESPALESEPSEHKPPADAKADADPEAGIPPLQLSLGFTHHRYTLPSTELLNPPRPLKLARAPQDQRQQLEQTLQSFGIQAKVVEVHRGPVITRYDLQPAAGVKVSRIVSLADDLALALAARGLRIEAPIPGKAALGIEVPNREAVPVTLREVIENKEFSGSGTVSFALGRDIAGEVVLGDLTRMPHLLIAGATGSGKSVCLNTIVMSMLYKAGPDRIKMIMIDPKMVELTAYNGIPHLIAPVVTEAKRAPGALKWAVTEMEQRYKRLMEAGCRDIDTYNRHQTDPDACLPYVAIFIDELADLMMIARVEVEDSICRLAQMARATGMHLVIATQRPSVDVITGLIKANIPSRIAFAVSSVTDSRTILDSGGAERLLGRGDMLYAPVGVLKPRRVQGALVSEAEVAKVVEFWRSQAGPPVKAPEFKEESRASGKDPASEDDLFWDAVKVVVDFQQASASILQRRLRVGYTRAARLVDLMEAKGFVGPFEGSKAREVRITLEELAAMRDQS